MKQPHKHTALLFIALGIVAVLLLLIDMATGDTYIPILKVWAVLTGGEYDETTRNILLSIRFIRVVVAGLIGVALSVSGLQMQTVFQNPLADPYLLGVSSGAGLGVALFILGAPLLGWTNFPLLQSMGIVGSGWIGTAVILLGVAVISRKVKNILGVLIMGVMIGYVAGAIIQILQYLSSAEQLKMFTLWSMGSLSHITATQLGVMIPMLCIGLLISVACIKSLNLLLLGENYARTMGMNIKRSRTFIFVSTALLTGTVTAFCGPVGFIGLAVPHVTRLLFNNADHRLLVPGTMLTGLISMLLCDIIAKSFLLPVNCITALLGVPVILWVIAKNLRTLLETVNARMTGGQLIALLGRNGAGKSTLLRAMMGLEKPQSGEIILQGKKITSLKPEKLARSISFVTTDKVRIANLRCKDVVSMGRAPYTNWIGQLRPEDEMRVDTAIQLVGMSAYAEKTMDKMSDGECQRIMIARALAQDTPVILLDEPTAFLDLPNRYELCLLLKRLAQEEDKCILFSTHDLDIALSLCDSIMLIDNPHMYTLPTPEMVASGHIERLFRNESVTFDAQKMRVRIK